METKQETKCRPSTTLHIAVFDRSDEALLNDYEEMITQAHLDEPGVMELFQSMVESAQFTSIAFTGVLLREKIAVSMDGRGACRDNVIVERLWRSVKYEEVYLRLRSVSPGSGCRAGLWRRGEGRAPAV